jgi:hypothetical protein
MESNKPDIIKSIAEMHRAGAAFLIADLRLALTMLDTADLLAEEKRAWGYQNARCAYQAVSTFQARLKLTAPERTAIDDLRAVLKNRLDKQNP